MRRAMLWLTAIIVVALAIVWFSGPRVVTDTTITFDPAAIGPDPDAYLAAEEARVPGIRSGLEKEIVWAYPASRAKTPLALVYLHGFSASKGEIRPVPDAVAEALGANLFYTRLTGHGQDGPAMATATVNAWLNDTAEAIAIGKRIGEKVILIATSTGGSLATWAAAHPTLGTEIDGLVLISPNYGVQGAGANLLTGPWAATLARQIIGKERGFTPSSEEQAHLWTTPYPTEAVLPMAATVALARAVQPQTLKIPALFLTSDEDKVIRPDLVHETAAKWGGPHEIMVVKDAGDPSSHVIAGDAFSPEKNAEVEEQIIGWIRKTFD